MTDAYPPQPWHLRGSMYLAWWRLPTRLMPDHWRLPASARPLVVGRSVSLVTFWVDNQPGGTLAYRELLVALAVRERRRVAACAMDAWVDNEQSLRGGRELWGVPKQLGSLFFSGTAPTSRAGHRGWVRGTVRTCLVPRTRATGGRGQEPVTGLHQDLLRFPGRLTLRSHLLQPSPDSPGRLEETEYVPLLLSGTAHLGRARLATHAGGPLGYLSGRRPWLALSMQDFRFTVGQPPP
ncbi:acetoacetate decarboxylase family protein [Streptomyces sp. NPDC054864]